MAFNISFRCLAIVFLAVLATVQGTLGEIECEYLSHDTCAFAVSYEGKRCVLEKRVKRTGEEAYTCKTSEIEAEKQKNHIESDECIKACGLDRKSFGISSDSLLETRFTQNLCSPQCYQSCPNIVDLYFNLAAGEGVFLPKLCEAQGANARRQMSEMKSSGIVAPGPVHSLHFTAIPPQSFDAAEFAAEPALTPGLP
ncbi:uncharacterized protein LOC109789362 [Cajanus cajan]|uniref:PAR1 protein n=1 Tax=Cajanus cajan TaxID=3821 RepID=A0A151R7K1_CAJCA|nr:uncharacterized protein LOC109789362 [Cajanus cajan]KYP38507.1 hypothetical protein KK1_040244 [Cajanus cajan]